MHVHPKWSLFYQLVRFSLRIAHWVFYNKMEVNGQENIPSDKPIIFVANHQCTFADPILLSFYSKRQPAFLTRSDVFKKKPVAWFLNKIRMMPIYRQRDGADFIEKNEKIFDNCVELLENNKDYIIFAEGSHSGVRKLRRLKKGFARMAFAALEKNDYNLDIHVVPVGLEYESHFKFRSNFFINFGEPLRILDYAELHKENPQKALIKVTNGVYERLKKQVIHIKSPQHYEATEELRIISNKAVKNQLGKKGNRLNTWFETDKAMIAGLEQLEAEKPDEMTNLANQVMDYSQQLKKEKLRDWLFAPNAFSNAGMIGKVFLMWLLLPFYLFGVIHNYLPYKIPVWFTEKTFKDPLFYSSVRIVMGWVLFPLSYLIYLLLAGAILSFGSTPWWIYVFSLLLSGFFAARYWLATRKIAGAWRFNRFRKKSPQKAEALKKQREGILTQVLQAVEFVKG